MEPKLLALKLFLDELKIDASIDTLDDRKRVQKAIYLGQLTGADLGYRFGWYIRGPYSPDLTKDYYSLADLPVAHESEKGPVKLKPSVCAQLGVIRPLLEPPPGLALAQEDWLELLASLHYLRTVSRYPADKARQEIEEKKPHLKSYIAQAERELGKTPGLPGNVFRNQQTCS